MATVGRKEPPVQVHDHFDGWANCVQCRGVCRLEGAEFHLSSVVRHMVLSRVRQGLGLSISERMTLGDAGAQPDELLAAAKQAKDSSIPRIVEDCEGGDAP